MRALFNPAWHPVEPCHNGDGTDEHWSTSWIHQTGSLTEALRVRCRDELTVRVLHHQFEPAIAEAAAELGIMPMHSVLHREVVICDGQTPLVFACSLLPEQALTGRFEPLRELGARPLGHWLFSQPALTRASLSQAWLPAREPLFSRLRNPQELPRALPGRKTLFTGALTPFLVSEFFLPALESRSVE